LFLFRSQTLVVFLDTPSRLNFFRRDPPVPLPPSAAVESFVVVNRLPFGRPPPPLLLMVILRIRPRNVLVPFETFTFVCPGTKSFEKVPFFVPSWVIPHSSFLGFGCVEDCFEVRLRNSRVFPPTASYVVRSSVLGPLTRFIPLLFGRTRFPSPELFFRMYCSPMNPVVLRILRGRGPSVPTFVTVLLVPRFVIPFLRGS